MERIATEYVEFKTVAGVGETEFIGIVDVLEQQFHSQKPGFISTELCKTGDGSWVMLQHWATMADAKSVVGQMMRDPVTEGFRKVIDATTVKMKLMEQYMVW